MKDKTSSVMIEDDVPFFDDMFHRIFPFDEQENEHEEQTLGHPAPAGISCRERRMQYAAIIVSAGTGGTRSTDFDGTGYPGPIRRPIVTKA